MATVTIQEAARRLGVKPSKVRALISEHKLAARPTSLLAGTRGRDDLVLDADEVETLARLRAHKRRARTAGREWEGPGATPTAPSDTPILSAPAADTPDGATPREPARSAHAAAALTEYDHAAAALANPAPVAGAAGASRDGASPSEAAASAATAVDPANGPWRAADAGTPDTDTPSDRAAQADGAATPGDDARRGQATGEDDEARRALSGDVESSTALDLAGQRTVALVRSMLTPLFGELHDARETIRRQAEELGALRAAVAELERRVPLAAPGAAPRLVEPSPESPVLESPNSSTAQPARDTATFPFRVAARQRRPALWRRALSHFIGD